MCCVAMKGFSELWMDLFLGGSRVLCAFWLNMCWEGGTASLIQKQAPGCCDKVKDDELTSGHTYSELFTEQDLWGMNSVDEGMNGGVVEGAKERLKERV